VNGSVHSLHQSLSRVPALPSHEEDHHGRHGDYDEPDHHSSIHAPSLAEEIALNLLVEGSIPSGLTILRKSLASLAATDGEP